MSREYSGVISLAKNARGIYTLDPTIGCRAGMESQPGGCFGDCYAAKSAKLYGYDFSKTVLRDFMNEYHRREIVRKIDRIPLDFVRMGTSGDPSEDWPHTVSILKKIDKCNKQIVIICKHWTTLTPEHLDYFATINVCVNTSVSALDKPEVLARALREYEKLKPFCKSVLRVVSCDFNLENERGRELAMIQHDLFKNEATLDTVLRVGKRNPLVTSGVINVKQSKFLGKNALISKLNKKTYFGKCSTCLEMCGLNTNLSSIDYPEKRGIYKQTKLF